MKIAEIITETNLNKLSSENSKNNKLLVVDFFATWCGPCQMYIPIFDKVSNHVEENIHMVKVDIDTVSEETANKFDVTVVPTTLFIKNGETVEKRQGFISEDQLKKLIEQHSK